MVISAAGVRLLCAVGQLNRIYNEWMGQIMRVSSISACMKQDHCYLRNCSRSLSAITNPARQLDAVIV
jgi:hypothetical protein